MHWSQPLNIHCVSRRSVEVLKQRRMITPIVQSQCLAEVYFFCIGRFQWWDKNGLCYQWKQDATQFPGQRDNRCISVWSSCKLGWRVVISIPSVPDWAVHSKSLSPFFPASASLTVSGIRVKNSGVRGWGKTCSIHCFPILSIPLLTLKSEERHGSSSASSLPLNLSTVSGMLTNKYSPMHLENLGSFKNPQASIYVSVTSSMLLEWQWIVGGEGISMFTGRVTAKATVGPAKVMIQIQLQELYPLQTKF